jgi:hypothetical protein
MKMSKTGLIVFAKHGYSRNQLLIDLSYIPNEVKERIIKTYDEIKPRPHALNY